MFPLVKRPEDHTVDYFISKNESALKKENWPLLDFPTITLSRSRANLYYSRRLLTEKRLNYISKSKDLHRQWREIAQLGLQLRKNLIQFNSFIKENIEKKHRALANIHEQKRNRAKSEVEVKELQKKIEKMKAAKISMDKEVTTHRIYELFLHKAVDAGIIFKNPDDLVAQYETFMSTRNELMFRQEESLKKFEMAKVDMDDFVTKKELVLVGLHNTLASLQSRYDDAVFKSRRWENVLIKLRNVTIQKAFDIQSVRNSIWNNYVLMCQRKQLKPKVVSIEEQLVMIKQTIHELDTVRTIINSKSFKEARRSINFSTH